MPINSVLRVLERHIAILPQLPASLMCAHSLSLSALLSYLKTCKCYCSSLPSLPISGVREHAQNLLEKDEQGRES